uniref:DUF834 domain-containing protein n=1 Tax=Oryza glumipatula TaxID=40148 RepID=A0A0E0BJ01_9ORYZ
MAGRLRLRRRYWHQGTVPVYFFYHQQNSVRSISGDGGTTREGEDLGVSGIRRAETSFSRCGDAGVEAEESGKVGSSDGGVEAVTVWGKRGRERGGEVAGVEAEKSKKMGGGDGSVEAMTMWRERRGGRGAAATPACMRWSRGK